MGYEDATGFLIGAFVVMAIICLALVFSPRIVRAFTWLVQNRQNPRNVRPMIGMKPDSEAPTTDPDLEALAALRDSGQISEERFLELQARLARRKQD